jgi:hypothetical protein
MSGIDKDPVISHYLAGTMDNIPVVVNLEAMFPGLEHQPMRFVLHVRGLRDIPSQTRLIDMKGWKRSKNWRIIRTTSWT